MDRKRKRKKGKRIIKLSTVGLVACIIGILYALLSQAFRSAMPVEADLEYVAFIEQLEAGNVEKAEFISTNDTVNITLRNGDRYSIIDPKYDTFKKKLLENGVEISVAKRQLSDAVSDVMTTLPMLVFLIVFIVYIGKYMGNSAETMFKVLKAEDILSFDDVAGLSDTKKEIQFTVEMLKNHKNLKELGARPCKGILLEGPPGTGKTLLAKAIAGEAGVPFISTSGSDFVEMFVGLGAARVRALWKLAKVNAPCVVFIDEIDAVGRRRQSANSAAQMEGNQTLNAILQKMDGLEGNEGILVVAATNMRSDLDPALLRPGRFDRHFYVGAPKTKKDRDEIIDIHIKDKKLSDKLDMDTVSKSLSFLTGAEIETVLNEAVYISLQKGEGGLLDNECIEKAVMQLRVGGTISSNYSERDTKIVAAHEAGHAIINRIHDRKVAKISIVPYTTGVGGVTIQDPDELYEKRLRTVSDIEEDIDILLGGMAAEKVLFGQHSQGCSNDLKEATKLVVNSYIGIGSSDNLVSLDGIADMFKGIDYDSLVIKRANHILEQRLKMVIQWLEDNREELEELSNRLIEEMTIYDYDGEIRKTEMRLV